MIEGLIITMFIGFIILKMTLEIFLKGTDIGRIITPLFVFVTFALQMWLVMNTSSSICGKIQWKDVLIFGLGYWLLIFGSIFLIINIIPGWKQPFSNFFGYLIVKLMGIKDVFNNLLKPASKVNDPKLASVIEKVYQDKSVMINTFTPSNFDDAIAALKGIFINTSSLDYKTNMEKLSHLVFVKDKVAENIWLAAAGWLSLTYASMLATGSSCNLTPEQLKTHMENYNKELENDKKTKDAIDKQKRAQVIRE